MTDFTTWTDEELCRELAAWATRQGDRVSARNFQRMKDEYDKRCGVVHPSEDEWFEQYMTRLREAQGEAA